MRGKTTLNYITIIKEDVKKKGNDFATRKLNGATVVTEFYGRRLRVKKL